MGAFKFNLFLGFILSFAASCSCCKCKEISNDYSQYPKPELIFPGLSSVAIKNGDDPVWPWAKLITSSIASYIPGGVMIDFLLDSVDTVKEMAQDTEGAFQNLINDELAKALMRDIQSKIVTVKNRIQEIQSHVNQRTSYSIPLGIAWNTCEEILQKYSREDSYLFKDNNALPSSPSLVSFANLLSGLAVLAYKDSPTKKTHIVRELTLLIRTLEKYRSKAVKKRISYFKLERRKGDECKLRMDDCQDNFYKIMSSCESCKNVDCEITEGSFFIPPPVYVSKPFSLSMFRRYESELIEKYSNFFSQAIAKVGNLLKSLGHSVNYTLNETFPEAELIEIIEKMYPIPPYG